MNLYRIYYNVRTNKTKEMLSMMRELMNIIKEGEGYCKTMKGISFIEWSKVEALGFPSIDKYFVDAQDLEEIINDAIENNTMSLSDIAKLEQVQTLLEVM